VSNWINMTLARVAIETGFFTGSSTGSALAAAATSATFPTSLITLEYITCTYAGQTLELGQAPSFEYLLWLRAQGTSSGPPTVFFLRQNTVEFWPAAAGGEIMTYYGTVLPSTFSGSTACPLPEPFSKLIEQGAIYEGAQFKKDPLIDEYRYLFDQWLSRFIAFCNRRRGKMPQQFQVWPGSGAFVPHDPSADWSRPWQV